MVNHVVMFSGGVGSWATARRLRDTVNPEQLTLLFADTLMEDEDLYRFLDEAAADVGGDLVKVAEGRDPWKVFFDSRFLGNHRIDPCSRILKRDLLRKWLEENCDPAETVVYLGIDWSEEHRFTKAQKHWAPWDCRSPLCDPPYRMKQEFLDDLSFRGIRPPRLYEMGFPHNNCGGFCVKAGQAHFRLLLKTMPERYAYHEAKEQELREFLGKDVAILTDRSGGRSGAARRPMTLREFREREEFDGDDWGGCSCFMPEED